MQTGRRLENYTYARLALSAQPGATRFPTEILDLQVSSPYTPEAGGLLLTPTPSLSLQSWLMFPKNYNFFQMSDFFIFKMCTLEFIKYKMFTFFPGKKFH